MNKREAEIGNNFFRACSSQAGVGAVKQFFVDFFLQKIMRIPTGCLFNIIRLPLKYIIYVCTLGYNNIHVSTEPQSNKIDRIFAKP